MTWDKAPVDAATVKELARRYGLDLISAAILVRRGASDRETLRFLFADDLLRLHNPYLFRQMPAVVERIRQAAAQGEAVQIFGDRDVDGITSTIMMLRVLQKRSMRVSWQIPTGDDDYGLTLEAVQRMAAEGVRLLVTVDCGISNGEAIQRAGALGIDTIILDHHNPPESLPDAAAIIDPKCEDSGYPFRELAGCGVVAKVALALALSDTPLYQKPVWLLNAAPANETCVVEAVQLCNLLPTERVQDSIPAAAGAEALERTRVGARLSGEEVLVYGLPGQARQLAAIGGHAGLRLQDLQPQVEEHFPELRGKSLLRIRELNALSSCLAGGSELDVLVDLYTALAWRKYGLEEKVEEVLDLAALGTIADLMPLVNENRILVRRGLAVMNRMARPGLRELLVRQNLHGRRLTAKDISWHVAPVLNSAGRLGEPEKAAQLFLSESPEETELLVDAILELNRRRKQLADRIWDLCLPKAKGSLERSEGKFSFVSDAEIPRGITGILAARMVSFFKLPALVVSLGREKAVGSLRSPYGMNGFLELFDDIFSSYGGHDRAGGFSLPLGLFSAFERRFLAVAREHCPPDREEARVVVDAEVPPPYLTPELIKVVERFEPFGEGCPPLCFLTRGVRIEALEVVGRKEQAHLRLLIRAGMHKWPAVYWNAAERAGRDFNLNDTVDMVFRLNRNYFMNTESLQLTVIDLKK
jgi:single-stranded-DNA-specific exonuclease